MDTNTDRSWLLRRALQSNGVFSAVSGVAFVVAASPIAEAIGIAYPVVILVIGISLLGFAVSLFMNAAGANVNQLLATLAVAGDAAWVAGTAIVILLGVLNTTGNWAAAAIADVVLVFAVLQFVGLRRMRQN